MDNLDGKVKQRATQAKYEATKFLERELGRDTITDPFELAITTYALTVVKSDENEVAFNKLDQIKRKQGKREKSTKRWVQKNEPTRIPNIIFPSTSIVC